MCPIADFNDYVKYRKDHENWESVKRQRLIQGVHYTHVYVHSPEQALHLGMALLVHILPVHHDLQSLKSAIAHDST